MILYDEIKMAELEHYNYCTKKHYQWKLT